MAKVNLSVEGYTFTQSGETIQHLLDNVENNINIDEDNKNNLNAKNFSDLVKNVDENIKNLKTHTTAEVIDHPDLSVTTEKIADKAITKGKIADYAVGLTQLAQGAVNNNRITNNAVDTRTLQDKSVTKAKLELDLQNQINTFANNDADILSRLDDLESQSGRVVDSELSDTSENPVANKAITSVLKILLAKSVPLTNYFYNNDGYSIYVNTPLSTDEIYSFTNTGEEAHYIDTINDLDYEYAVISPVDGRGSINIGETVHIKFTTETDGINRIAYIVRLDAIVDTESAENKLSRLPWHYYSGDDITLNLDEEPVVGSIYFFQNTGSTFPNDNSIAHNIDTIKTPNNTYMVKSSVDNYDWVSVNDLVFLTFTEDVYNSNGVRAVNIISRQKILITDSELSDESTSPLQNKVIKAELDKKYETNEASKEFLDNLSNIDDVTTQIGRDIEVTSLKVANNLTLKDNIYFENGVNGVGTAGYLTVGEIVDALDKEISDRKEAIQTLEQSTLPLEVTGDTYIGGTIVQEENWTEKTLSLMDTYDWTSQGELKIKYELKHSRLYPDAIYVDFRKAPDNTTDIYYTYVSAGQTEVQLGGDSYFYTFDTTITQDGIAYFQVGTFADGGADMIYGKLNVVDIETTIAYPVAYIKTRETEDWMRLLGEDERDLLENKINSLNQQIATLLETVSALEGRVNSLELQQEVSLPDEEVTPLE